MSETQAQERKRRPRDWQQPKTVGECCTEENLGDPETLAGTIRAFRRCGKCNRRHFLSARESAIAALRDSGDDEAADLLESTK